MSDDSKVTALIKQLLILNRAESTATIESSAEKEAEGRKVKQKRIRQELVQVLHLRARKVLNCTAAPDTQAFPRASFAEVVPLGGSGKPIRGV
jgi:hypothetical protein